MIVRDAIENDAAGIRDVIEATYGRYYVYPQFYDVQALRRMILGEDTIMLVAEEPGTGRIFGTASVILEVGAYSDLTGEFGRLAVLPEARGRGIGALLMSERLRRVRDRLHMGIVEARVPHPFSQRIAQRHGFVPVGFLPLKNLFRSRESVALHAQWFGDGLGLRRNHPRIIPEVYPIACAVAANVGMKADMIIDDTAPPYPHDYDFSLDELTTTGYTGLLHIERGRTKHRVVFGPIRLHYGFFRLRAEHAQYLVARRGSRIAGALGYVRDDAEHTIRIFELISPDDQAITFLLGTLERRCRESSEIAYMEIDVRADAPSIQRTLLELGFVPGAYLPAFVFHDVERLDVVRMIRILCPLELDPVELLRTVQTMADLVVESAAEQQVVPQISAAVRRAGIFQGLTDEQTARLAGICTIRCFRPDEPLLHESGVGNTLFLVLSGEAHVHVGEHCVGTVGPGEVLGERRLLTATPHTATARAHDCLKAASIEYAALTALIRRRPDIGVVIYRNLAKGLGDKLWRADRIGDLA